MKVKVLREFIDKYTKQLHKVGEEFEVDEKRFEEIQTVGNLVVKVEEPEIVEEPTEEVEETKPTKGKKK